MSVWFFFFILFFILFYFLPRPLIPLPVLLVSAAFGMLLFCFFYLLDLQLPTTPSNTLGWRPSAGRCGHGAKDAQYKAEKKQASGHRKSLLTDSTCLPGFVSGSGPRLNHRVCVCTCACACGTVPGRHFITSCSSALRLVALFQPRLIFFFFFVFLSAMKHWN